ncbi:MAG: efflux RND transporter permease subunit, partial [Candidatus Aminicenantes bacterium]|nr:efflux RND transporter permease subunit [Candidatus Aminicenantes bacterium]
MSFREFKPASIAVDGRTTVFILLIMIVLFGVMQYQATPKEEMPEIVFPYYMIGTIYPGTSPADVENLITRPLEKQLKGINGVKKISSNSIQDYSSIFIEFDITADDMQAYQDVKQAVDDARSQLPSDLIRDPQIRRIDLSEIPVLYINLTGELGLVRLKQLAEDLQDRIEGLEEITRVDIAGALDREVQINVDLYKMQAAGLNFNTIRNAVASENLILSGGRVDTDGMRRNLRIVGEFTSVSQIGAIILQDGITLGDIAEITDGFKDRESYSRLNSQDVVTLNVIKRGGKNLIAASDKIQAILADFKASVPDNLVITVSGDSSKKTRHGVSDLFNTIILGFVVVVFVLMFFMGRINAIFVGAAIPLSMLISFIFLPLIGFTLNKVVLMSFILVLGIVVDNSIVVVENIYRHFMTTENLPIIPATKKAVGEVAPAVFTGTLTTMAPFFPLVFTPGIAGRFMSFLPITIILSLTASLLVAYFVNPVFAVAFMKYQPRENTRVAPRLSRRALIGSGVSIVLAAVFYAVGPMLIANLLAFGVLMFFLIRFVLDRWVDRFQNRLMPAFMKRYRRALSFCLKGRRPWAVVGAVTALFLSSFLLMRISPPRVVFFPSGEPNVLYVYLTMPEGTHIEVTDRICRDVEDSVRRIIGADNPDVESIVSNVAVNAGSSLFERSTQDKLAKVTVTFVEYKERKGSKSTRQLLDDLRRELKDVPGAQIRIDREAMGPPAGAPVNIEISGEDVDELIAVTSRLEEFITALGIPGIERFKSSMEVSKPEIILEIDREKANRLGLSTAQIGSALRTAIYGVEVSKFKEGEDEIPIQMRLDRRYRNDLEALLSQTLTVNARGGSPAKEIPISAVARVSNLSSVGGITRIDNKRVITLSSNVLTGYNANQIIQTIRQALPRFELKPRYTVSFTGEQDMQKEVGGFFGKALVIAVFLIFVILVGQFNSLAKPGIIITQIFFSFTGVLLGFTIFKLEFSVMMTGMGIIAVAGIVVKNAILIIDYTDKLYAQFEDKREALVEAAAIRLTPVLLTALSTILGLLPLAIGMNFNFETLFTRLDPQFYWGGDNAAFWNPLAWTIIFGLTFTTILTLVVVPAMYAIVIARRDEKKTRKAGS